jgi:hypothetical protein
MQTNIRRQPSSASAVVEWCTCCESGICRFGAGEPFAVDGFADDRGQHRRVASPALALARGARTRLVDAGATASAPRHWRRCTASTSQSSDRTASRCRPPSTTRSCGSPARPTTSSSTKPERPLRRSRRSPMSRRRPQAVVRFAKGPRCGRGSGGLRVRCAGVSCPWAVGLAPSPAFGHSGGGGQGRSLTRRHHRYGTTVMRLVGGGPIGTPVSVGSR